MLFDAPACFRLDHIPVRPGRPSRFWIQGAVGAGKPRPYLQNREAHPSTHPLAVAAVLGLRQPSPSAWSPGVCGRTARHSGSGPIRPCRTASVTADEGKADRPPSRVVSALRP
jgi:hypothetical protein